jgi:lysophospholipase L1-like esterase
MSRRPALLVPLLFGLGGCGHSSSLTGPGPVPTPPGNDVALVVFYDENANGTAEVSEVARVPDVEVSVGGRTARSDKGTGRAVVAGVPAGTYQVGVRADTLPPFYAAGAPVTVQAPMAVGSQVFVPLVLPIGTNQPNQYMAFGDSITRGDGSTDGRGYPARLQAKLQTQFGVASMRNRGAEATNSFEGVERVKRNLNNDAYVLILYGTNDWNIPECQGAPPCQVADNLRVIVEDVKAVHSLPFIATLTPANPAVNPGRNQWIAAVNDWIKAMARQEGAFLVDLYQAFQQQGGDLSRFFSDDVHPNDAGYEVIATGFFEAIAHGRATPASTAGDGPAFGFAAPVRHARRD